MPVDEFKHLVVFSARCIGRNATLFEPSNPRFRTFERFCKKLLMNPISNPKNRRTESRHSHPLDRDVHEERFPFTQVGTSGSLVHRFQERGEFVFDASKQFFERDRVLVRWI